MEGKLAAIKEERKKRGSKDDRFFFFFGGNIFVETSLNELILWLFHHLKFIPQGVPDWMDLFSFTKLLFYFYNNLVSK
jgi:hypothetical protein